HPISQRIDFLFGNSTWLVTQIRNDTLVPADLQPTLFLARPRPRPLARRETRGRSGAGQGHRAMAARALEIQFSRPHREEQWPGGVDGADYTASVEARSAA